MELDSTIGLLFEGSCLETVEELNFLESEQSIYNFYPSQSLPLTGSDCVSKSSYEEIHRDKMDRFSESPPFFYPEISEHLAETAELLAQSEGSGFDKSVLIERKCSLRERFVLAIEYLKEYVLDREILIQIWIPVIKDNKNLLITTDQPFFVHPNSKSLASYRNVSENFHLSADMDRHELTGLPGRAFLWKFPEWSPDVRFFRNEECPRKSYAELYNISSCLAVPVFEQDSETCLAVVEIVTTTQKTSYHLELEIIDKAFEAVDLKSSQYCSYPGSRVRGGFCQTVVPNLSEISQSVCKKYELPLALTWALHSQQCRSEFQQFMENHPSRISVVDSGCFVADTDLLEFQLACSEQELFLDQGIVGKAFKTRKQCFANDVTSFSKASYPLSHHAKMFGLGAAVAIPLQSVYTGSVEFVLELFLPKSCRNIKEQKQILQPLSSFLSRACSSFNIVISKEAEDEISHQTEVDSDGSFVIEETRRSVISHQEEHCLEQSSLIQHNMEAQRKGQPVPGTWDCAKEEPEEEFMLTPRWDTDDLHFGHMEDDGELWNFEHDSRTKNVRISTSVGGKVGEKRQTKPEKKIGLQVIRQYFAGSLKDAAKNMGVCPTTLKRICRQYGIARWPARKIQKVNHSLKKLQLVMDSVKGAEGLVRLDSFYTTFPDLKSANDPDNAIVSPVKMNENSVKLNEQNESDSHSSKDTNSNDSESRTNCCNTPKQPNTNNGFCAEQNPLSDCVFRVKATYGKENIRFSLQPTWSFKILKQEIAKRFDIEDFSRIYLKYLDNDEEEVLLTCDADLTELRDLFGSAESQTIKIFLHRADRLKLGS